MITKYSIKHSMGDWGESRAGKDTVDGEIVGDVWGHQWYYKPQCYFAGIFSGKVSWFNAHSEVQWNFGEVKGHTSKRFQTFPKGTVITFTQE